MQSKLVIVAAATAFGVGLGAILGFGPLLKYKSEAVLSMELGTSEYKRFTELANDANSITQFAAINVPPLVDKEDLNLLVKIIAKGEWHKPVPKVSKLDSKELSDAVLQMEREVEKEKEKDLATGSKVRRSSAVYLGLRLNYQAANPQEAAQMATWMGDYFKQVATREAVREQLFKWSAENLQFLDRALEQKLKYEFEIEQAKNRITGLKKIIAIYPGATGRENSQVVDVRKDNEKFISPTAQLVGSESEIIDITEKIAKLNREIEQQEFAGSVLSEAKTSLQKSQSGTESVGKLVAIFASSGKKVKSDAEREKLLAFTAELSQISARFLSQAQFIAQPSVPSRPERPTPLMYMALVGILFALMSAIYLWRDTLLQMLKQDDNAS